MRFANIGTSSFVCFFLMTLLVSANLDEINTPSFDNMAKYTSSTFKAKKIQKYINYFSNTEKGRSFYKRVYPRQWQFDKTVKKIFAQYNIPKEFKYVSMIESGFNYNARSRAGAVGLWQFIPSTAKIFGLRIDEWVDERRDPYRATVAAAEYFTSLKKKFGSWELVLAGYNSGDLTVKAAIEKYNSKDFWYLSRHTFPKQTREYVPQILAVITISKNLTKYGFEDLKIEDGIDIEQVEVPPGTRLDYIATLINIDGDLLRRLNPSILRRITPPDASYFINVPAGYKEKVYAKFQINRDLHTYKIEKGDTLSGIALKFSNSIDEIYILNNLSSSTIYAGDTILVYKKSSPSGQ
ncbi:MAG: hypothetical protein CMN79_02935 [Spirochaetales bacterium]|nr:hypothetical protein [Spirochaetales bacterium]